MNIGSLIGGTMIVEQIFRVTGVGSLLIGSIITRDYAIVQLAALVLAVLVIPVNLLADLPYAPLDPRVSLGAWTRSRRTPQPRPGGSPGSRPAARRSASGSRLFALIVVARAPRPVDRAVRSRRARARRRASSHQRRRTRSAPTSSVGTASPA